MFSRKKLLALTQLAADNYTSMARRGQLPFALETQDDAGRYRPFSPFEALLLQVAIDVGATVSIDRSQIAQMVGHANAQLLWPHLKALQSSGEAIRLRRRSVIDVSPFEDIWLANVWFDIPNRKDARHSIAFAGTREEIEARIAEVKLPIRGEYRTNVSESAATLIERAFELDIDLADLWIEVDQ
jgi:hypothetical protein